MLSKPRRPPHGPPLPHADRLTTTRPGCRSASAPGVSPNRSSACGRYPCTRTSAPESSSCSRRGAAAVPEVEQRAALAGQPVVGVQRQFRPLRRVEPEHLRAERGQVPGGHRPGDDPGEVEHPDPRGGQRSRRRAAAAARRPIEPPLDQLEPRRPPGPAGAARQASSPRTAAATPPAPTTRSSISRARRPAMAAATASGSACCAERAQQCLAMPGIVPVRAHPAVGGAPEPRQRRETRARAARR